MKLNEELIRGNRPCNAGLNWFINKYPYGEELWVVWDKMPEDMWKFWLACHLLPWEQAFEAVVKIVESSVTDLVNLDREGGYFLPPLPPEVLDVVNSGMTTKNYGVLDRFFLRVVDESYEQEIRPEEFWVVCISDSISYLAQAEINGQENREWCMYLYSAIESCFYFQARIVGDDGMEDVFLECTKILEEYMTKIWPKENQYSRYIKNITDKAIIGEGDDRGLFIEGVFFCLCELPDNTDVVVVWYDNELWLLEIGQNRMYCALEGARTNDWYFQSQDDFSKLSSFMKEGTDFDNAGWEDLFIAIITCMGEYNPFPAETEWPGYSPQ